MKGTDMFNNFKIQSVWGAFASNYNPELPCNNNGNYPQPSGGALIDVNGLDVVILVDDTSCGDFGSRIHVSVDDGCHLWRMNFGTMDDVSIDDDEYIDDVLMSISGCFGIIAGALLDTAIDAVNFAARTSLYALEASRED